MDFLFLDMLLASTSLAFMANFLYSYIWPGSPKAIPCLPVFEWDPCREVHYNFQALCGWGYCIFFVAAVCLNSRMGRSRIKKAALRTLRRQCGQKGGSAAAGGGSSAKTVQKKIRLLELRGSSEIPSHDFMHSPKKESTVRSRNGLILDLRAFVIESVRGIFAVWIFV